MELTAEDLKRLPKGLFVKFKCDNPSCKRPIASTMVYRGSSGQDYCSNACYEACEGPSGIKHKKGTSASMAKEEVKKKKRSEEDEPKKKKRAVEDDEPKKKKKKPADDDESESKPEKKKKSADDDEPKNKSSNSNNPYRSGSAGYEVFEMALAGTTRKKIVKYCEENDIAPARLLRELKLGDFRDIKWKYTEDEDGAIKVTVRKNKD